MFKERIAVETPEHVAVEFEIAGPMTRLAAGVIDLLIVTSVLIAVGFGFIALAGATFAGAGNTGMDFAAATAVVTMVFILWGYWPLFELFMDGQTPGKKALGIRVVRRDFLPLDGRSVFLRNVIRLLDMQPGVLHAVGLATMILSSRALRFGDMVAGTWVVRERTESGLRVRKKKSVDALAEVASGPSAGDGLAGGGAGSTAAGRLTPKEYQVVEQFLQRRHSLERKVRLRLAGEIAGPIRERLGDEAEPGPSVRSAERFLEEEHARGTGRGLV
ncbi:MAG: RDD family protein [Planctomycetota bacterium]|jgi:uncharacterized RDD family membrane protein YckC